MPIYNSILAGAKWSNTYARMALYRILGDLHAAFPHRVRCFVDDLAQKDGKSFEEFEQEFFTTMRPTSLIQRFAETDEVASMVCYLSSPKASATTGAAVRVDGGVVKSAF